MTSLSSAHRILAALIEARTGQQLTPSRAWRIDTALAPLMRELSCPSLETLTALLATGDEALTTRVVEALLNNETSFYRDRDVFTLVEGQLLPALQQVRGTQQRIDIWCAGCSTGQEPYSLAMIFGEAALRWRDWTVSIVGTDVSASAVTRAKAGRFSRFEIQRGLPVRGMLRWFKEVGEEWQAVAELRRGVRFQKHNLFDPPPGRFDVIFCRNVLMYFSLQDRRRAFERLAEALTPEGLLVLGAGETVLGQTELFTPHPVMRGLYHRSNVAAIAA